VGLETQIDIFNTILKIRQQRAGFVQTELQYKFIYLALKCYVEQRKLRQPPVPVMVSSAFKPILERCFHPIQRTQGTNVRNTRS